MSHNNQDLQTLKLLRQQMLLKLYENSLFAHRQEEIANSYGYFFGESIDKAAPPAPLLIIDNQKRQSLAFEMSFEVAQSMGAQVFTNPDYKTADLNDMLIHTIDASLPSSVQKIERIQAIPQMTFVNFTNVDSIEPSVLKALQKLEQEKPAHIFWALESKTSNVPSLGFEVSTISLPALDANQINDSSVNSTKLKM